MSSRNIYPFTQRDLLVQPEYYMFSAFYGKTFLSEFFNQRGTFIADFEICYLLKLKNMNQPAAFWLSNWRGILEQNGNLLSEDIQAIHAQLLPLISEGQPLNSPQLITDLDSVSNIDTEQTLRLLLIISVEQNQKNRDSYLFWLTRFLKRFEVSKKIYSTYQPTMKNASIEFHCPLNYALLSLVLLYDYEWNENLKMLNTVLKLNDLLCSRSNYIKEPETLLATILAFHKERLVIQQIMTEKGLSI